jgi:hypothetical protein
MISIILLCLGVCLGSVITIIFIGRYKATVLKDRISELENEMLCSHAEILRLEREITAVIFSDALKATG